MPPPPPPPPPAPASQTQTDDGHFPQGQCRYILTQQDVKGHRCACVTFSRNKALPGAVCDCGHQACFHLTSADAPSPGQNRDEIQTLKQRLGVLEAQQQQLTPIDSDHGALRSVIPRLSLLEETLDKSREDLHNEIKASYRNISAAWQTIEQLRKQLHTFENSYRIQSEQLARAGKELQDLRNRNLELLETDEMLEERIEKLEGEGMDTLLSPAQELAGRGFGHDNNLMPMLASRVPRRSGSSVAARSLPPPLRFSAQPATPQETPRAHSADSQSGSTSHSWTVHVSLLPSREQPFPFEKDTNAYKRCLSRGLQRMVAIEGHSGEHFVAGVSRAFRDVLRGAPWAPLQAEICDAKNLQGQPMLRPHEDIFEPSDYDVEFLRQQCAVCDGDGRVEALYLALRHGILSWPMIKSFPVFVEGLESSWEHDPYLDDSGLEDRKPTTAGISCQQELLLSSGLASMKRRASELESPAMGLSAEGTLTSETAEGLRLKKSRTCIPDLVKIR